MNSAFTIFGPPGTGKTHTLIEYAAGASEHGKGVMFLSFTKAAAEEARDRVMRLLPLTSQNRVKAGTMHSLAYRMLDISQAQVVDHRKLVEITKLTGVQFKRGTGDDDEPMEGDDYMAVIAFARNKKIELLEAYQHLGAPGTMAKFNSFAWTYESWKKTYGYKDFDDMIVEAEQWPLQYYPRFDVLMLDEAQDCTPIQWDFFYKLVQACKGPVYIAGDDDQAIFEWSGADPRGMIDFSTWANANIRVLNQSIRVPRKMHQLMHDSVLPHIQDRHPKEFAPRDDEGEILQYGDIAGFPFQRFADEGGGMILVRDRYRMLEVMKLLNADRVPYDVAGGTSPWTSIWGRSVRAIQKLLSGQSNLNEGEMNALKKNMIPDLFKTVEAEETLPSFPNWWDYFSFVPRTIIDFYDGLDMLIPRNIVLSTVHRAKGKEARQVMVDLTLSARAMDQFTNNPSAEARILYVAATRASHRLMLCGSSPLI